MTSQSLASVPGYTNGTAWVCTGGVMPAGDADTVAVAENATVVCTITNTRDTGSLTLVKSVSGGTEAATSWNLSAAGPTAVTNVPTGTTTTVKTGTYDLSEAAKAGVVGYTNGTTWVCKVGAPPGVDATMTDGDSVVVAKGQNVTCTITNTRDTGTLKLVKRVVGGAALPTEWKLSAAGPTPITNVETGTTTTVLTGSYVLSESGTVAGYTNGDTWICDDGINDIDVVPVGFNTLVISKGESYTCTITNSRDSGSLKLVKSVSGGTAAPTAWDLSAAGPTPVVNVKSGTSTAVLTGNYDLSESGPVAGYTNGTTWVCTVDGAPIAMIDGDSVAVAKGKEVVCTITNTRDTGTLKLVKSVSGGNEPATSWPLSAAGPTPVTNVPSDTQTTVNTGTYDLSESGTVAGYTNGTAWVCTGGTMPAGDLDTVVVAKGQTVVCTITNTRDTGTLTLVKQVDGGTALASSWTLFAAGPTAGVSGTSGAAAVTNKSVLTGTYTLSETGSVLNYVNGTTWACTGAATKTATTVTVAKGETVTCTIVNRYASIDVVKSVGYATGATCPTTGYFDSLSPVLVGSLLCFQFVITNNGKVALDPVTLTDSRFSLATTPTTCSVPSTVSGTGISVGAVAVNAAVTCWTGPVPAVFNGGTSYVNTATAIGCAATMCLPSPSDTDTASYAPGYLGFTPGFWKNHTTGNSNNAWQPKYLGACGPLTPNTPVSTIFTNLAGTVKTRSGAAISSLTLLQALGLKGGPGVEGANEILVRAATAAYLNACYSATLLPAGGAGAYPLTTAQVVSQTVTALNSATRQVKIDLATKLDVYNNTATHQITW